MATTAARLYRNNINQNKERNSLKLKIDCKTRIAENSETKDWLELVKLFDHDSSNVVVYRALLEKRNNIVAKIGKFGLEIEWGIAKKLEEINLPTFIQLSCIFSCLDNFSNLNTTTKEVCKGQGTPISIILMPYIGEGSIDKWNWVRSNFDLMKNIIKHIFLSLIYANNKLGFIHRDIHLGNILLKKTTRKEISYGEYGSLELNGVLPIIMDFDKSGFIEKYDVLLYKDLSYFIGLMSNYCNVKFNCNSIQDFLDKTLTQCNTPMSPSICEKLCNYVDKFEIRKVDSEIPQLPPWMLPQKSR